MLPSLGQMCQEGSVAIWPPGICNSLYCMTIISHFDPLQAERTEENFRCHSPPCPLRGWRTSFLLHIKMNNCISHLTKFYNYVLTYSLFFITMRPCDINMFIANDFLPHVWCLRTAGCYMQSHRYAQAFTVMRMRSESAVDPLINLAHVFSRDT